VSHNCVRRKEWNGKPHQNKWTRRFGPNEK
jgi:hypothetical protein